MAKVQLGSAAALRLPCADAAAAAAAAAAVPAFAATVSAAAGPALPPGASIVPAAPGPETGQLRGSRNRRQPTDLRHRGSGGTGSGRGPRGNPGEPGPERGSGKGPGWRGLKSPELGLSLPGPSFPAKWGRSPGGRPRR